VCAPKPCPAYDDIKKAANELAPDSPNDENNNPCVGYTHGDVCEYRCADGTRAKNGQNEIRTCNNGGWTGSALTDCKDFPDCPTLNPPPGGTGSSCQGAHGDTCSTLTCQNGFTSNVDLATNPLTCFESVWTGTMLTCTQAGTCSQLTSSQFPGAQFRTCSGYTDGQTCTFSCQTGYDIQGSGTYTCSGATDPDNPVWTNAQPFSCVPKTCPTLTSPANAVSGTCAGAVEGDTCQFFCQTGYGVVNGGARTCTDGAWSGSALQCIAQNCQTLNTPQNGVGDPCASATEGDTCTFSCSTGYTLAGDATRTCSAGQWQGQTAICALSTQRYVFTASDWSECTETCGGGTRTRIVQCLDSENGMVEVDKDVYCADQHEVDEIEACNTASCPQFFWEAEEWGICSTSCNTGRRERVVRCTAGGIRVYDSFCAEQLEMDKPTTWEECNQTPCVAGTFHWAFSTGIGLCDNKCGGGTQVLSWECRDHNDNAVPDGSCTDPKPPTSQDCNMFDCAESAEWSVCGWDDCTAECGGSGAGGGLMAGTRVRTIECVTQDSRKVVPDELCNVYSRKEPTTEYGCNPQDCKDYNWMTTIWSACSETGTRLRTSHCHDPDMGNAPNEDCDPAKKPHSEEECIPGACPAEFGGPSMSAAGQTVPALATLALGLALLR
jgi:thrombospondin motif-containing protein 9